MQNAPLLCQRGAEKLFFAAVNADLAQQVLDDLGPADQPAGGGHKGVAGGHRAARSGGGFLDFLLQRRQGLLLRKDDLHLAQAALAALEADDLGQRVHRCFFIFGNSGLFAYLQNVAFCSKIYE